MITIHKAEKWSLSCSSTTLAGMYASQRAHDACRLIYIRRTTDAAVNSFGVERKRLRMRVWYRARVEYRRGEP